MRVLVISYFWPPAVRASMHWQFAMVKNFRKFGIEPVVLTVEEETFDTKKDYTLLEDFPSDIEVIKTKTCEPFNIYRKFNKIEPNRQLVSSETISKKNKKLSHRISIWIRMNLFIPDARVGWYFYAVKKMKEYLKKEKVDAILSVGPPHSSHLIGLKLAKKYNIPYFPVFEDPWMDIVYYRDFKRSKLTLLIDGYFESEVLKNATNTIFVTKSMEEDYLKKYPFLQGESKVLYWGYNESGFTNIKMPEKQAGEFWIVHTGNIFDYQNPKNFWKTISKKINEGLNIKLKFSGTVSPVIKEEIHKNGLDDRVEYLGFLNYNEMLGYLLQGDLLLVCPTEKRHVPGKLFEYLRSGRTIVAFGDDNEEVAKIITDCNAGKLYNYDDTAEDIFERFKDFSTDLIKVKEFSREKICENLSKIIETQVKENKFKKQA